MVIRRMSNYHKGGVILEHLSIEEIIEYVTANKVSKETLDLMSRVNGHIRICSSCREKIESYERINEKLIKESLIGDSSFNDVDEIIKMKKAIDNYY